MSSGRSSRAALRSITRPEMGLKTSETDLVDSTSPKGWPAWTSVPTSGTSTYTTSPSASWAKSVIPTRMRPSPSSRAHSCSFVYLSSSGYSTDAPPATSRHAPFDRLDLGDRQCSHIGGGRHVAHHAARPQPLDGRSHDGMSAARTRSDLAAGGGHPSG